MRAVYPDQLDYEGFALNNMSISDSNARLKTYGASYCCTRDDRIHNNIQHVSRDTFVFDFCHLLK